MASLLALSALSQSLGHKLNEQHVVPIVIQLCSDPIPNIRFNSAKTLELIVNFVDPNVVTERINPCLTFMVNDPDRDVQFFSKRALSKLIH